MASPRNRAKNERRDDPKDQNNKSSSEAKSSSNAGGTQKKLPFPEALRNFKLRPVEMIGLGLVFVAILFYMFRDSDRTPQGASGAGTNGGNPRIADSTQLAERASNLRPLYVIIDSLKLRARPQLDSNFIRYLDYDELVYDMGEQTQSTQTIRYSADEVRTEPWVKIRTQKGEVGWVFGAGVNFYRKKRRLPPPPSTLGDSTARTTATQGATTTATRPATTTTTAPSAVVTASGSSSTTVIAPPTATTTQPATRPNTTPPRPR